MSLKKHYKHIRLHYMSGLMIILITGFQTVTKAQPLPVNMQNINTPADDYWPAISADGNFFATTISLRNDTLRLASQEDIMIFRRGSDLLWHPDSTLTAPLNTKGNEGAPSFSADGRYLFFVAADRQGGFGSCDIYYVIRHGNTWSRPIHPEAPLNTRFWESNPSLSSDGKTLFFASNRPGGKGGMDIWQCRVTLQTDGLLSFSDVTNAGDSINTQKNESSPFIHPDNRTLYFSSDGHGGYGQNDIFMSKQDSAGHWHAPLNLGSVINTPGDDAGFVVETGGQYGYFSSNGRENNGNGREIYRVALPADCRPEHVNCISGSILPNDGALPFKATVELTDLTTGHIVSSWPSDNITGQYWVCYPAGGHYSLTAIARAHLFRSIELTDTLKQENFVLPSIKSGATIALRNLYFAFDSYELTPESLPELNRLGRFLIEYPSVQIEVDGHTDNAGSSGYNLRLSEKRAKAVTDYLEKGGISPQRLSYKGYGATQPIAPNETPQGQALNRRTELTIK
jgi:outer membrane protein OmpA-like peptidoglycan-associated protein